MHIYDKYPKIEEKQHFLKMSLLCLSPHFLKIGISDYCLYVCIHMYPLMTPIFTKTFLIGRVWFFFYVSLPNLTWLTCADYIYSLPLSLATFLLVCPFFGLVCFTHLSFSFFFLSLSLSLSLSFEFFVDTGGSISMYIWLVTTQIRPNRTEPTDTQNKKKPTQQINCRMMLCWR